jgi:hypothetical protein
MVENLNQDSLLISDSVRTIKLVEVIMT